MKIVKINFSDKDFPEFPTTNITYSGCRTKDLVKILRALPEEAIINRITIKDEEQ